MKQTLILSPRYSEDSIIIRKVAFELGWDVQRLPGWRIPEHVKTSDREFILYGEPLFVTAVADQLGIKLHEPPFDWLTTVPEKYTKRKIIYTTLGQARELTEPHFIKPPNDKVFQAKVYLTGKDLPEYVEDTEPVLISEPVEWQLEVRTFILEQKVMTCSPYWREGKLAQDETGDWPFHSVEKEEALEFAQTILSDDRIELPTTVVMDIGIIMGKGWAVLEANPPYGSGIYGCDPEEILKVLYEGGK